MKLVKTIARILAVTDCYPVQTPPLHTALGFGIPEASLTGQPIMPRLVLMVAQQIGVFTLVYNQVKGQLPPFPGYTGPVAHPKLPFRDVPGRDAMFLTSSILALCLLAPPTLAVTVGLEASSCHEGDELSVWLERGDTGFGADCEWTFDEGVTITAEQGDMLTVACPACEGREPADFGLYIICETTQGNQAWDFAEVDVICDAPEDTGEEARDGRCGCSSTTAAGGPGGLLLLAALLLRRRRAADPSAG